MTVRQSRIGNITDHAARALELIDQIEAAGLATPELLAALLRQMILDLDEVGLHREVIRAADMLGVAALQLGDRPAGTEAGP